MNKNMNAVKLRYLLDHREVNALSKESMDLFDEIYNLLERIEPIGDNERKQFWMKVPRGCLDDFEFEDESEALEYFNVDNKSELQSAFEFNYPDEYYWYQIISVKYKNNRALLIGNFTISLQPDVEDKLGRSFEYDCSELLSWAVSAVKDVISECEAGTYNSRIQAELPYTKRYGVISRRTLWDHCPAYRENELGDLTKEEIGHFINVISAEEKIPTARMGEMTFNKYFEYASLSFKNAGLSVGQATPFDAFLAHGEDFGVMRFDGIDLDSPDAFRDFLVGERCGGGHPWGLRRGTSRSRIMLYPVLDENGYYFTYSGNPNWNVYEMVKMYLPLKEAGLPVVFLCPEETIRYLREEDRVGFVPNDELTVYRQSAFKERINDFYHFNPETDDKIKDMIEWYPVDAVKLKEN